MYLILLEAINFYYYILKMDVCKTRICMKITWATRYFWAYAAETFCIPSFYGIWLGMSNSMPLPWNSETLEDEVLLFGGFLSKPEESQQARVILAPTASLYITVRTIVRYALKKNTGLFGNFFQMADPPPFGNPLFKKKKLVFILHFRPLGTFLILTKKLKFCQYFYIYFWE